MIDGTGEIWELEDWSVNGFRGRWQENHGIEVVVELKGHEVVPYPGGYYCAVRLDRGA